MGSFGIDTVGSHLGLQLGARFAFLGAWALIVNALADGDLRKFVGD